MKPTDFEDTMKCFEQLHEATSCSYSAKLYPALKGKRDTNSQVKSADISSSGRRTDRKQSHEYFLAVKST
jgi:hypothetical protein